MHVILVAPRRQDRHRTRGNSINHRSGSIQHGFWTCLLAVEPLCVRLLKQMVPDLEMAMSTCAVPISS
jgi:hypothetical protein